MSEEFNQRAINVATFAKHVDEQNLSGHKYPKVVWPYMLLRII